MLHLLYSYSDVRPAVRDLLFKQILVIKEYIGQKAPTNASLYGLKKQNHSFEVMWSKSGFKSFWDACQTLNSAP